MTYLILAYVIYFIFSRAASLYTVLYFRNKGDKHDLGDAKGYMFLLFPPVVGDITQFIYYPFALSAWMKDDEWLDNLFDELMESLYPSKYKDEE